MNKLTRPKRKLSYPINEKLKINQVFIIHLYSTIQQTHIQVSENCKYITQKRMGNQYNICQTSRTIETNLYVQRTQVKQIVPLVQSVHKTLQQFIQDNSDFFNEQSMAIAHILFTYPNFQQQINKYPIERINQHMRVFLPNLTKEDFTVYEGQCLIFDFKNQQLYMGQVSCGKKDGQGVLINKNGNTYQGIWRNDRQNGHGVLQILYPKRTYKGQWRNGKLQGPGLATYEDGAKYEGQFQQGKKHGMGTLTFYDGASYEGSFQTDLMHGFGTLTSIKGRQISGEWKNGKYQSLRPDRSSKTFSINELPAI